MEQYLTAIRSSWVDLCRLQMEREGHHYEFSSTVLYYYSGLNLSILFQMKIAITQRQTIINGITYDCLEPGWYRLFNQHKVIIVPNLIYVDLDVDMLILSGGDLSKDRSQTELACYNYANDHHIPVLGVCHGAFVINYLHGGLNKEISGHRNVMHSVEMEKQIHVVNSYHDIGIHTLGDDLECIATNEGSIEAFKHKTRPQWGILWHPERMEDPVLPAELKELING